MEVRELKDRHTEKLGFIMQQLNLRKFIMYRAEGRGGVIFVGTISDCSQEESVVGVLFCFNYWLFGDPMEI